MRLSICIPTYNRARHLADCLASIAKNRRESSVTFEVCVSDNGSTDNTADVVAAAQLDMPITYSRNPENLGIPSNFLKVVGMATGEFAWLLGDDDLLMPGAIDKLDRLIGEHPKVDLFYINANHLRTDYVERFPHPFDTDNLPRDMKPFSCWRKDGELPYLDLVDPRISFDFMGGMFLSVFRREMWASHTGALEAAAIADRRTFSHFDNTFPHVKIFTRAFARSTAYFHGEPLSVCLTGAREWAPMYPLVHAVRLVEALEHYRAAGLPLLRYLACRNFALSNFIPELAFMALHPDVSGYAYIDPLHLFLRNALYPNTYLSVLYFAWRRLKRLLPGA